MSGGQADQVGVTELVGTIDVLGAQLSAGQISGPELAPRVLSDTSQHIESCLRTFSQPEQES